MIWRWRLRYKHSSSRSVASYWEMCENWKWEGEVLISLLAALTLERERERTSNSAIDDDDGDDDTQKRKQTNFFLFSSIPITWARLNSARLGSSSSSKEIRNWYFIVSCETIWRGRGSERVSEWGSIWSEFFLQSMLSITQRHYRKKWILLSLIFFKDEKEWLL